MLRFYPFWLFLLIPAFWTASARAAQSITVGMGNFGKGWAVLQESSRLLSVSQDSIWMWDVRANSNLAPGFPERGGSTRYEDTETGSFFVAPERPSLKGGEAMCDGDGSTRFDPDESTEVDRTTPVFIDLGGAFRIDRIRFYPRLDRVNKHRFLQEFVLSTSTDLYGGYEPLLNFSDLTPNVEPVVDRRFPGRDVRYIQILPTANREWEIAELEVYGDGSAPVGEFVSTVLRATNLWPVWGKVHFEGGDIAQLPAQIQTRTGPDSDPMHYFLQIEDELIRTSRESWLEAISFGYQGLVQPNPAWSAWENLDEGRVRSPGLRPYLQFRVRMNEPGLVLRRLIFDYVFPPLVRELDAELDPAVVAGGKETEFALSMLVYLQGTDTGFRQFQVLTAAQVHVVEQVLVDDQEVGFTAIREPGRGFTVNLWRRILQNGTFVQVFFRGSVFRDRTRFEVRALDRRADEEEVDTAYQIAGEADVDPVSVGGSLTVRLEREEDQVPLIVNLKGSSGIFTPNGDGVNDAFELSYTLLKLVRPVPVFLEIFDLGGRSVRRVEAGRESVGNYSCVWDGRDEDGVRVPPGLYLYELRVESDQRNGQRQGIVGVAY